MSARELFLLPDEKIELAEKLENCGNNPACKAWVERDYRGISDVRDEQFSQAFDACKANANNCQAFFDIHYDLRQKLTLEGNEYFKNNPDDFDLLPNFQAIYHTYVTDDNGNVINETTQQLNYRKFIHPIIGYEVVLDENDNIVTDSVNAGTYNFYNPAYPLTSKSYLLEGWNLHEDFDVKPYFLYGNDEFDTSTVNQRNNRHQVLWNEE